MHAYDAPDIGPHEFLLTIMRDRTLDLHLRMNAAHELCRVGLGDIGTVRTMLIIIRAECLLQLRHLPQLQQLINMASPLTQDVLLTTDHHAVTRASIWLRTHEHDVSQCNTSAHMVTQLCCITFITCPRSSVACPMRSSVSTGRFCPVEFRSMCQLLPTQSAKDHGRSTRFHSHFDSRSTIPVSHSADPGPLLN